jgi:CBS-domain-containing membrane protein
MKAFRNLQTCSLQSVDRILRPAEESNIDINSSALRILTDFSTQKPLMIEEQTSVEDAKALMKRAHVRLKLVIDHEENFKGIVSLADLVSVKVIQARERTGLPLADLAVTDVMTEHKALRGIDLRELKQARIGDLLSTMQSVGEQHVLVIDKVDGCIRGIVSASDIARRLHVPVFIAERAHTFSDIYRAVSA